MFTESVAIHPVPDDEDPFQRGRPGFAITLAYGVVEPPLALALSRLPEHGRAHGADHHTWWVAREHLPVLRRFLDGLADAPLAASA